MAGQTKTGNGPKKGPSLDHLSPRRISRTSASYWRGKLQNTVSASGIENSQYSVRIGYRGHKVRFSLQTANKDAAASKAAKIFSHLIENGWDATLAKYKPSAVQSAPETRKPHTVGDLITANQRFSTARKQSLHAYAIAFRRIVSGVMERVDNQTYPCRKACGTSQWKERIDAVSLHDLSPERIQEWKQDYLEHAGKGAQRQATTTVNSLIRNAKALFSKKLLSFLESELDLPSPLPFEGVVMEKAPSPRYRSKIDAKEILERAHAELRDARPQPYKILLLAGVCGLRASEIDWLLWEAFDFHEKLLEIKDTAHHRLKSEDSAGEIALSDDMVRIFKKFAKQETGEFVIESTKVVTNSSSRSYRCEKHFKFLRRWLRAQGVTAQKPIHELRKEIGSIIASEEGIFAASRYLRHSDIRITSNIYADQKGRVIPSIGQKLLA